MLDLHQFIARHQKHFVHVRKPVPIDYVGALTAQARDTILFHDIRENPGFRLIDNLFVNRQAQARILECQPNQVVPRLAEVLRTGHRKLRTVDGGPCQERVLLGKDVDLAALPIVRHTDLDSYPYTTSFAIQRFPDGGPFNAMFPRCGILGPRARGFIFDPSVTPILAASPDTAQTRFPSVVGKWGIDATKPVPYRTAERKNFERAWPKAWNQALLAYFVDRPTGIGF